MKVHKKKLGISLDYYWVYIFCLVYQNISDLYFFSILIQILLFLVYYILHLDNIQFYINFFNKKINKFLTTIFNIFPILLYYSMYKIQYKGKKVSIWCQKSAKKVSEKYQKSIRKVSFFKCYIVFWGIGGAPSLRDFLLQRKMILSFLNIEQKIRICGCGHNFSAC